MNMAVLPPNSYAEILTPNVMVLVCGAFGRWSGQEGRTLMNWINVLIRGDMRELASCLSAMWRHSEKAGHLQTRKQAISRHRICWCLHARLPSLQNREESVSVVHKPPSLWSFVIAAQLMKTNTFHWYGHISPFIFINGSQSSTWCTWKGALCIVWTHSDPAISDIQVFQAI